MAITDIIILGIAILIIFISGIFSILAAQNVKKDPNYGTNVSLQKAHSNLTWASVIIWVGLLLILVALGLSMYFGSKDSKAVKLAEAEYSKGNYTRALSLFPQGASGKLVQILILGFTFLIILVAGVFAINASINIRKSGVTAGPANSGYTQSIVVSVMTIGGMGILLLAYIALLLIRKPAVTASIQQKYAALKTALGISPAPAATATATATAKVPTSRPIAATPTTMTFPSTVPVATPGAAAAMAATPTILH